MVLGGSRPRSPVVLMQDEAAAFARPRWPLWLTGLCPLGILTAASWVGTLHAPSLAATDPLVLLALSPRLPFLAAAAAAGAVPAPAFFLVGLARLVAADPSHYLIGRRGYGYVSDRLAGRSAAAHRVLSRVRAAVGSHGLLLVVLRPNGNVLCGAGAAGLRPLPVAGADVFGTASYLVFAWIVGQCFPSRVLEATVASTRAWCAVAAGAGMCAGARRLLRCRSSGRAVTPPTRTPPRTAQRVKAGLSRASSRLGEAPDEPAAPADVAGAPAPEQLHLQPLNSVVGDVHSPPRSTS